ncbi:MAG: thymidylate synthase [Clostridiales bacterium]|jgi:thymidylate synthase|nr:thymidylate synthase [Clostridiales bacterium]
MSSYDDQYLTIAEKILANGFLDQNRTGVAAYKLPHQIMQFDLRKEFPILTTKKVAFKTAVKELLWIFRDQSNDVRKLREEGVRVWDEWMMEDGTIGTSYGWVVKKFHQIDRLIDSLKHDPQNRRMMINLWQIPYLDTGALYPCCFATLWDVTDGYLNCILLQRSGDWGLGVPFNTSQYAALTAMLAQVTGHQPGLFTHVVNNAHIYENQAEAIRLQISRKASAYPAPELRLNPAIQDFYHYTMDDIQLVGYQSHESIKMEVAV